MKKIILASQSPRRREILRLVGLDFEVCVSDCDETQVTGDPENLVLRLSELKARAVLVKFKEKADTLIIGADTIVEYDGEIIGKPKDVQMAVQTLKKLSGNTHRVYTGVSVIDSLSGQCISFCERTDVTFYDISDEEIRNYVNSGEPMDKAGSYGIQGPGAFLVKKIDGDYFNVVGLPIARLLRILKDC